MSDKNKTLAVHEVAELTGITIRALHYYDEIGLLKPSIVTESRYRLYTEADLGRLQEILFFREVGFALKEIKLLMSSPDYDRAEALERQLDILNAQKERIDALISLVKSELEGKHHVSFAPFSGSRVKELQEKYREEVLARWGNTDSFKEYETIFSSKAWETQNEQLEAFLSAAQNMFERLALYENKSPGCGEVQQIVREWQGYISEHFYQCDRQMLSCLGRLYIEDERFSNYINRFGNGNLASFFGKAIELFCLRQKE